MGRYLRLWAAFIKNCMIRELSFRLNFILQALTGSTWFLMSVLTFWVVFQHTQEVAGWTKYEVLLLLGSSHLLMRLFMTLFMENLARLPELIRTGELDFYLVKPVSAQFVLSTRYFSSDAVADATVGISLMLYAASKLDLHPSLSGALLFGLLLLNGLALYYSIMFILVTSAFWFIRFNAMDIWWQLTNIVRQPAELFPGRIKAFLTWCLPMLIIVNFPVKALLGRLDLPSAALAMLASLLLLFASSAFFKLALKRYRSASS
jgi:ABC-2 type transport system permease protein